MRTMKRRRHPRHAVKMQCGGEGQKGGHGRLGFQNAFRQHQEVAETS